MIEELKKLGLTDGEAKVYDSLVNLKSSTVGPIIKHSRVAYSNVYDILERLMQKGLVSYILKGKTKHYQITSEHMFLEYLKQKMEELEEQQKIFENIRPLLKQTKEESKQESEIFIGLKGITTAYEIMLSTAKKGEEFLYFNIPRDEKVSKYYAQINWKFRNAGVILKGIADSRLRNDPYLIINKVNKSRFVDFPLPAVVDIFQDKILLVDWTRPVGILITSKEITEDFTKYFQALWKIAKE